MNEYLDRAVAWLVLVEARIAQQADRPCGGMYYRLIDAVVAPRADSQVVVKYMKHVEECRVKALLR